MGSVTKTTGTTGGTDGPDEAEIDEAEASVMEELADEVGAVADDEAEGVVLAEEAVVDLAAATVDRILNALNDMNDRAKRLGFDGAGHLVRMAENAVANGALATHEVVDGALALARKLSGGVSFDVEPSDWTRTDAAKWRPVSTKVEQTWKIEVPTDVTAVAPTKVEVVDNAEVVPHGGRPEGERAVFKGTEVVIGKRVEGRGPVRYEVVLQDGTRTIVRASSLEAPAPAKPKAKTIKSAKKPKASKVQARAAQKIAKTSKSAKSAKKGR
ncbi:MAG: hypothetical protein IT371_30255 [Deltaproteobacteria bacterium]|nr:hypothetical protein [Deltaproteobacteria bacterium]